MRCLLIEDDRETASYIKNGLQQQGHVVDAVAGGREGLLLGIDQSYNVLIADRMLPGADGLPIVKTLRAAHARTPVLFLNRASG